MNAGGLSAFGTMAQIGNMEEWEEDARWFNHGVRDIGFSYRDSREPERQSGGQGFRVVSVTPVPEPSTLMLVLPALLFFRRRREGSFSPDHLRVAEHRSVPRKAP